MRIVLFLFMVIVLSGCIQLQTPIAETKNSVNNNVANFISVIRAKFPLYLGEVNLQDSTKKIGLDSNVLATIDRTVRAYAKDIVFADSMQTYKDLYLQTICLQDSNYSVFLVLLQHYPTGLLNSKILFYDNTSRQFVGEPLAFNLSALYDVDSVFLKPSNLKSEFKISLSEISLIDFDKDGNSDFKLVTLRHNGTVNALHTTIYGIKDNRINTLLSQEKSYPLN